MEKSKSNAWIDRLGPSKGLDWLSPTAIVGQRFCAWATKSNRGTNTPSLVTPPSYRSKTEDVRRRLPHGQSSPLSPSQSSDLIPRLRRRGGAMRSCWARGATTPPPPPESAAMDEGYANLPTSHLLGSVPVTDPLPPPLLLSASRVSFFVWCFVVWWFGCDGFCRPPWPPKRGSPHPSPKVATPPRLRVGFQG